MHIGNCGPGDFFGDRQHGLPAFELADLGADTEILAQTREEAQRLMREDPELASCPALAAAVQRLRERLQ